MNQFGPPPPPTSAGTVMLNSPHSLAPSGSSTGPPDHRQLTAGVQHSGAPMESSRSSYQQRHRGGGDGVQQNMGKYRSVAGSGGGTPGQYTRPPPPLVGVQLLPSTNHCSVSVIADVCVSAKQKGKELKEKTPMCLVNELARFNKVTCFLYLNNKILYYGYHCVVIGK